MYVDGMQASWSKLIDLCSNFMEYVSVWHLLLMIRSYTYYVWHSSEVYTGNTWFF